MRFSALPQDTRVKVEDLPFECWELFSDIMDEILDCIPKYMITAKALGIIPNSNQPCKQNYWPRYFHYSMSFLYSEYRYQALLSSQLSLRPPSPSNPRIGGITAVITVSQLPSSPRDQYCKGSRMPCLAGETF